MVVVRAIPLRKGVKAILGEQEVTVQIAKRNELHTFKVMPKRWIVERSFACLDKNRRLWKNCERKLNTSLQFIHLAFLALILKKSEKEAEESEERIHDQRELIAKENSRRGWIRPKVPTSE